MKRVIFILLGVLGVVGTAVAQSESMTAFRDVTVAAGIDMVREGDGRITGQAFADVNGDGWLDLYLTDTEGPNVLYINNGDGTYGRSAHADQIALPLNFSGGAVFADYDNDGDPDLYVLNWGKNALFRNDGDAGFTDVTDTAGVGDDSNGQTASWGDFNADGWTDLYVANWACSPRCGRPVEGDKDRLYQNNGDGTFTDVTNWLGGKTRGAGFVANFVDYDNDGDQDIYLINDEFINPVGNVLWRNDGPGCDGWCFEDVSEQANADTFVMGMGLATADYDRDGDLDFYFSNAGPMVLLQNQGDGTFLDVADATGTLFPDGIGWGTVFLDYDNDGWTDLYLGVMDNIATSAMNPLFRNNSDGTFSDVGAESGAGSIGKTIGVAYGDVDQDGWVDLVVGNFDEGYHLYRNQGAALYDHNWVTFRLVGGGPVTMDAVGTRVTVQASDGRSQIQELINGASLGSGNALELYYGLGSATIASVEVRWLDGTVQTFDALPVNQMITLRYGQDPIYAASDAEMVTTWPQTAVAMLGLVGLVIVGVVLVRRTRRAGQ